jgi:DNA modification methylase
MKPTEIIGDCHLFLGDCREILPHLPKVDLVLTDPPYGIGIASKPVRQMYEKLDWDAAPPSAGTINDCIAHGKTAIVWGGNYFGLPAAQCFLIWDKIQPHEFSLAMAEMAWTNKGGPAKMHRQSVLSYSKEHPTQKPVELMEWCLDLVKKCETVADPFAGSGTTGVACVRMGKTFYGIEREPKYFDIAVRRIEAAYAQARLFA